MPTDPTALLRRVVAAYDALQTAHRDHANDAAFIEAAQGQLAAAVDEARRVASAPQPWRRETSRRR